MRTRKICCLLLALALLLVSISPLSARNTPIPRIPDEPIAHPWQDDNQTAPDTDPVTRIVIVVGGIYVGVEIPGFLIPSGIKSVPVTTGASTTISSRPFVKKSNRGIKSVVSTKGL